MRTLPVVASALNNVIVGKVTKSPKPLWGRRDSVYVTATRPSLLRSLGYACVVTSDISSDELTTPSVVIKPEDADALAEGDVILVNSGCIEFLWDSQSDQNVFFITPVCNESCRMCPQPSRSETGEDVARFIKAARLADVRTVSAVCISGGEPFLFPERVKQVLNRCREENPEVVVNILTNGTLLSDAALVRDVVACAPPRTTFCVSLHADTPMTHDRIANTTGAFDKTLAGLYNLCKAGARSEVRVVVSKLNAHRLHAMPDFIFRNLSFVSHVAVMGMEYTGYARDRLSELYVEPMEYSSLLKPCICGLALRGMNVSLYNYPHCFLPPELWPFAVQSISRWKNTYHADCAGCSAQSSCCGLFGTSGDIASKGLRPFTTGPMQHVQSSSIPDSGPRAFALG